MKQIFKNNTTRFIFSTILIILFTLFFIIFYSPAFSGKKAQAASAPSFLKKHQTLSIKKQGSSKITNHKKSKASNQKPNSQKKRKILSNAKFQVKKTINPWNFTLVLSCNRILLKKEIQSDKLTIYPKGKKSPRLTASFTSLSANGKEVTYTLSPESQKKLCPGDYSRNGAYLLSSLRFSKKLPLSYEERLAKNTLSGFVLKTDGNSVKNALVTLKRGTKTLKKCFTDKNGYYKLRNISDATSLTVEKSGFHQYTILNPAISAKKTTCENIVLKSIKATGTAMEFFVTDNDNHPLSDISIMILADRSIQSTETNSVVQKNGVTPNSSANESFSKKDILFSGKTDSSGKLFLANYNADNSAACSNIQIGNHTQLSYSSFSEFTSTNKTILSSSILNQTEHYTIYIKNTSLQDSNTHYKSRKINFSFSNLITNHAFFQIQLEKCQNTSIQNLKLQCENSPILCRSLSLKFYHPDYQESFFQYTIEKENWNLSENQIILSSVLLPVSLPDDIYYMTIQAFSEENNTMFLSNFVIFQITNSTIAPLSAALHKPRYARILAYGDLGSNSFSFQKASFQLYQCYLDCYFLIDTVTTELFSKTKAAYSTSNLYLKNLLPNQKYLLIPLSDAVAAKDFLFFTTTENNIFLARENAIYNSFPLAKINCFLTDNSSFYPIVPNDFSRETIHVSYQSFHNISKEFVRAHSSYPNCVIAIHKTNGLLLSATLTTPATNKRAFNSHTTIIDIYTSNETIITNQASYHS